MIQNNRIIQGPYIISSFKRYVSTIASSAQVTPICDLYYSNSFLDSDSLNFNLPVNNNKNDSSASHSLLRFTPNYRFKSGLNTNLINNTTNKRLIYSSNVKSNKLNSSEIQNTVASICHPSSKNIDDDDNNNNNNTNTSLGKSHIPFEVKTKTKIDDDRSVLQKYLQGDCKNLKQLINPYITLTKPHLTFLIMLSSICSYQLAPNSGDLVKFFYLTIGTLMASGAANAINMGREPNFDSQMVRTSSRPVVKGLVKPNEAFTFAAITGSLGCTILYYGVNPIVSALGALNIVLYSWIYTSLKRKSILNTWVGAIVGAIPPLMGWATCSSLNEPGAWCLALLLYAWQFPHFNSLSHNIKDEYKRAGYVMTAFVNPKLNARVALRYSLAMFPICFAMCYFGVCDNFFAIDSSILNAWMTYNAFKFWLQQRYNYSSKVLEIGGATVNDIAKANYWAKKTFWSSIWQLPVVLALAMLHKQGQWDHFFGSYNKEENDEQHKEIKLQ